MTDSAPLMWTWEGDVLRPASPFWARKADQQFVIGQTYMMVEQNERSHKSHAHYFAVIREAWLNLPEYLKDRFPSEDHLRSYALIKSGFCNSHTLTLSDPEVAQTVAAAMRPLDEFAVIDVQGSAITIYTAKTQSRRGMDKDTFQKSKDAVLGVLADLIRVSPRDLAQNAGRAA